MCQKYCHGSRNRLLTSGGEFWATGESPPATEFKMPPEHWRRSLGNGGTGSSSKFGVEGTDIDVLPKFLPVCAFLHTIL